ncbi:MAG: hypothetical protein JSS82_10795 [Bacteroidetes bacterium]|nr:hypothetical protein [Bacteroidota bacterium]
MEQIPNSNENIEAKWIKYKQAVQEVEQITDKLGTPVDEGIKETVAVLRAMGFPTTSSCAGHRTEDKFGLPYVKIYAPAPQKWLEDHKSAGAFKEWNAANAKYREQIMLLLNEFNQARKSAEDALLFLRNIGIYGGFKIENKANVELRTAEEGFEKCALYQKEMADFTEFLKQKYFKGW